MGYSCTVKAMRVLDAITRFCVQSTGSSNAWRSSDTNEGFFNEVGREQRDGAITGTVFRSISETHARRYGSFRITPDGKIARFPGIPKTTWKSFEAEAQAESARIGALLPGSSA